MIISEKNKLICVYILALFIAVFAIFGRFIFFDNNEYLAYFFDDFFYYLKVAENLYYNGQSSFNGIELTNGYHPLWLCVIYCLYFIAVLFNINIFYLISLVSVISILLIVKYIYQINTIFFGKINLAFISVVPIFHISIAFIKGGMEMVVLLPLWFYFIYAALTWDLKNIKKMFLLGLLMSFTILARLDVIFFFIIFIPIWLIKYKIPLKQIFYLLLGLIPFVIYLLINYIYFDSIVPVSGLAKQLTLTLTPKLPVFEAFISFRHRLIETAKIPFILTILNFLLFFILRKRFNINEMLYIFSITLFPIFLLTYQSIFSGWTLWQWYYYVLLQSYSVFIIIISKLVKIPNIKFIFIIILFLFSFIIQIYYYKSNPPERNPIYTAALEIKKFEKEHKGIYAMGDRAGLAAYLIKSPVIQTEGLMMNKKYLNNLKNMNLFQLLKLYDVEYYIANRPKKIENSKWFSEEPSIRINTIYKSSYILDCEPIDSIITNSWKNYIFYIPDCK